MSTKETGAPGASRHRRVGKNDGQVDGAMLRSNVS
jgi:hypothetical protein